MDDPVMRDEEGMELLSVMVEEMLGMERDFKS
jgi:hypothetical protein